MEVLEILGFLFILIFFSAVFSSSEISHIILTDEEVLGVLNRYFRKPIKKLRENFLLLLLLIVLGNTFVNTFFSSFLGALINSRLKEISELLSFFVSTLLSTFLIFLFAESLPKTLSYRYPEIVARLTSPVLSVIFPPTYFLFGKITVLLNKFLQSFKLSQESLLEYEILWTSRLYKSPTAKILESLYPILNTPLLNISEPIENICKLILVNQNINLIPKKELKDRRYVLVEREKGIFGVLEVMNFLKEFKIYKPFFCYEHLTLSEFYKRHGFLPKFIITVDEYGNVKGIVDLKILIRNTIEKGFFLTEKLHTVTLGGNQNMSILWEYLESPQEEFETVSTWLLKKLKRIPREGEEIDFGRFKVTIIKKKGEKIEKAKFFLR